MDLPDKETIHMLDAIICDIVITVASVFTATMYLSPWHHTDIPIGLRDRTTVCVMEYIYIYIYEMIKRMAEAVTKTSFQNAMCGLMSLI